MWNQSFAEQGSNFTISVNVNYYYLPCPSFMLHRTYCGASFRFFALQEHGYLVVYFSYLAEIQCAWNMSRKKQKHWTFVTFHRSFVKMGIAMKSQQSNNRSCCLLKSCPVQQSTLYCRLTYALRIKSTGWRGCAVHSYFWNTSLLNFRNYGSTEANQKTPKHLVNITF